MSRWFYFEILFYWWTRQGIDNALIVVHRYAILGDSATPGPTEPRLVSFYPHLSQVSIWHIKVGRMWPEKEFRIVPACDFILCCCALIWYCSVSSWSKRYYFICATLYLIPINRYKSFWVSVCLLSICAVSFEKRSNNRSAIGSGWASHSSNQNGSRKIPCHWRHER